MTVVTVVALSMAVTATMTAAAAAAAAVVVVWWRSTSASQWWTVWEAVAAPASVPVRCGRVG